MDIREEDGIPVFDINDTGKRVFDLVMRFGRRVDQGNRTLRPSQNGT
jgi:hypothetical protein